MYQLFGIRHKRELSIPPSWPCTKALTIQPQDHVIKNIDIQKHINIKLLLNIYFKDSNVIF